jgi:hypothetical protein
LLFSHGKVFVYTRSSDGIWSDEPQVLVASDKADGDYFGDSIAISGNRMIVGASEMYSNKLSDDGYSWDQRGKVYAFVKVGDEWLQDGEPLLPDDEVNLNFHFGAYVALDGDTALIGHASDIWWDDQIVHVFTRSADGWVQMLKLTPSDMGQSPDITQGFGRGVELQGDRALIWSHMWDWWPTAVMLENWQYVETENYPWYSDHLCQRCGMIALSSDAIFLGGRPPANAGESWADISGSVFVLDNYSVLPVSPCAIFDLTASLLLSFPHLRHLLSNVARQRRRYDSLDFRRPYSLWPRSLLWT